MVPDSKPEIKEWKVREGENVYPIDVQTPFEAKTDDDHLEQEDYFPSDIWLNAEEFFQS